MIEFAPALSEFAEKIIHSNQLNSSDAFEYF